MNQMFLKSVRATILVVSLASSIDAIADDGGFGKDIPLGVAAKQIVPEGYKLEMDGIDPGAKATWNGGSWRQAITTASKSAGYEAVITGQTVKIIKKNKTNETTNTERRNIEPHHKVSRDVTRERRRVRRSHDVVDRPRNEQIQREVPVEVISGGGFVIVNDTKGNENSNSNNMNIQKPENNQQKSIKYWEALEGKTLKSILEEWSVKAGWKLVWKSNFEYKLTASAKFSGEYTEASKELLRSMAGLRPMPTAQFFEGNKTLVISNDMSDVAGSN